MAVKKKIDEIEKLAGEEKFNADQVKYVRDVLASPRGDAALRLNEENFGPLESPEVSDLSRDPAARTARVAELRATIEHAQQQLIQLGEMEASPSGQVPLQSDGSVSDIHNGEDTSETREAKYRAMSNDALRSEIERRNGDGRPDSEKMSTVGNKNALVDALLEDDMYLAERDDN